jgi:hypothetical protein
MSRILMIDDDLELTSMLKSYLEQESFEVAICSDGASGLAVLSDQASWPDVIVLDVTMPHLDGFGVLAKLQTGGNFPPVLMLSARGDDEDRILGLDLGADDYLAKPCNPRELVSRIKAIIRRRTANGEANTIMSIGALRLDSGRLTGYLSGAAMSLTAAEFRVLEYLARNIGQVVSRAELTEYALCRKIELYDRSIDTHVSNLRRKLGGEAEIEIRGIRGSGYQMTPPLRS